MKEGLLERIQAGGHWRVNARPLQPIAERLSLGDCLRVVEAARVSIRGWDYPHISHRQDEQGGSARVGEYFENWCDWHTQIEFWRMYRSGQFLSYNALDDDVDLQGRPIRNLSIIGAIYSVTEFVEFAHRLYTNGLGHIGIELSVTLANSEGRQLSVGPGRIPFFDEKRTHAPSIEIKRTLEASELATRHVDVSIELLMELFDQFGWNPDPAQIRSDQERFYRRDWR